MPSGNEIAVSLTNFSPVTVTVNNSPTSSSTVQNGGTPNVSVTSVGDRGPAGPAGVSAIADATDVAIASVQAGDVLRYDSGKWRNYADIGLTDGGNF